MKPYKMHLHSSADLITTYDETRAGFISIALEKNRKATPYIEEARSLQYKIRLIKSPNHLFSNSNIRNGLIAASGISDKAANHLGEDGCDSAIKAFIKNFLVPAGNKFKEELVFRYLLTKGDALGGSMRNIVGAFAQKKVNSALIASLRLSDIAFSWFHDTSQKWISSLEDDSAGAIDYAKGLFWQTKSNKPRIILYNITTPFLGNNIDIILLHAHFSENLKDLLKKQSKYIALGELKGGIDPAGADEHWKTAKSAIDRIFNSFNKKGLSPLLFYIGAAIEAKMASEIWENLKSDYLSNAANLTKNDHISSLIEWLISL